jgi:hypothetical protein
MKILGYIAEIDIKEFIHGKERLDHFVRFLKK